MTRSLLDSSIKMEFLVSDESSLFVLLTPVKCYVQQMLLVKVNKRKRSESSEIVVTTVFTCNF